MDFTLHVWRQPSDATSGAFESHQAPDVSPESSFLEMLDQVNERLILEGREPSLWMEYTWLLASLPVLVALGWLARGPVVAREVR